MTKTKDKKQSVGEFVTLLALSACTIVGILFITSYAVGGLVNVFSFVGKVKENIEEVSSLQENLKAVDGEIRNLKIDVYELKCTDAGGKWDEGGISEEVVSFGGINRTVQAFHPLSCTKNGKEIDL